MGGVEFEVTIDPIAAEQWPDRMGGCLSSWSVQMLQNLSMLFHYYNRMLRLVVTCSKCQGKTSYF